MPERTVMLANVLQFYIFKLNIRIPIINKLKSCFIYVIYFNMYVVHTSDLRNIIY